MFSAQYNGEKLTLTGEYDYRWNCVQGCGVVFSDNPFVTESKYEQGSYQFLPKWQATVRYNVICPDKGDRSGSWAASFGLPNHIDYADDRMAILRWNIKTSWMLRAAYHRVRGTAWLFQADNPNRQMTVQDWNFMACNYRSGFRMLNG